MRCILFSLVFALRADVSVSAYSNVLVIVIDDLRPWFGAYNATWMKTPHVDKLAANGTVFTRAYANQAVCGPSRISFLTGRRPDTTQLYDFGSYWREVSGNFSTLPEYFRTVGGFHTRSVGKVFHPIGAMKRSKHADDVPYSWSSMPYHPDTQQFKNAPVCNNTDTDPSIEDDGKLHANIVCPVDDDLSSQPGHTLPDDDSAAEAARLLRDELGHAGQNFLLMVGFHKPHIPLKFPRRFLDLYPPGRNDSVPLPAAAARMKPDGMPPVAWDSFDDVRSRDDVAALNFSWPYGPVSTRYTRLVRRAYAAAISYVDEQVGVVLNALEDARLSASTAVVFFGDHSWQLGERGEFAKYSVAEVATRVPLIVRLPQSTSSGSRNSGAANQSTTTVPYSDALVELVDLFPSLAELAGLPPPPLCSMAHSSMTSTCVEGSSWAAHTRSNTTVLRKAAAFSQYPRPADVPRGPSEGNTDLPSLVNITRMGYSMHTNDDLRYTEWVSFRGNYSASGAIITSGPEWKSVHARELYNLSTDPLELNNLVADSRYAALVASLSARLQAGWRNALPK